MTTKNSTPAHSSPRPLTNVKVAACHNGVFHADDCFAAALLRRLRPEARIVRTRNGEELAKADLRFDVGGKYEPAAGDYDHHQREGAPSPRPNGVPYSSFGLLWKAYGREACSCEQVWEDIERGLVQPVDAADCGTNLYGDPLFEGVSHYGVSSAIAGQNPGWDEPSDPDEAFETAVEMASAILDREIARAEGTARAKDLVQSAIQAANEEGADPRIIVLPGFAPWQQHLVPNAAAEAARFVVFQDRSGQYRVQAIPRELGKFGSRMDLPERFRGLRAEELSALTGIEGMVFCHAAGFIAGTQTKDQALALAKLALDEAPAAS